LLTTACTSLTYFAAKRKATQTAVAKGRGGDEHGQRQRHGKDLDANEDNDRGNEDADADFGSAVEKADAGADTGGNADKTDEADDSVSFGDSGQSWTGNGNDRAASGW
jgi:hypothetical protein